MNDKITQSLISVTFMVITHIVSVKFKGHLSIRKNHIGSQFTPGGHPFHSPANRGRRKMGKLLMGWKFKSK